MNTKEYNPPVTKQIYLGSGKSGIQLRNNINLKRGGKSFSEFVVELMKKADPSLFKGIEYGK